MSKRELEKLAEKLSPLMDTKYHARELYTDGYEPKRHSFRKRFGNVEVCYVEDKDGWFYCGALIRLPLDEIGIRRIGGKNE